MKNIAAAIAQMPQLQLPLFEGLKKTTRSQLLYGLDDSARHLVMASIYVQTERPVVVITADAVHANKAYEDLLNIFGDEQVYLFPGKELLYYHNVLSDSGDTAAERLKVMKALAAGERPIVVTTVAGIVEKMCPRRQWQQYCFTLTVDAEYAMEQLLSLLVTAGYERVDLVEAAGQFSVRGGIIDIFPSGEATPYRLEFFGDLLESIRSFDPLTQRSQGAVQSLQLAPVREVIAAAEQRRQAITILAAEQEELAARQRQGLRGDNRLSRSWRRSWKNPGRVILSWFGKTLAVLLPAAGVTVRLVSRRRTDLS